MFLKYVNKPIFAYFYRTLLRCFIKNNERTNVPLESVIG